MEEVLSERLHARALVQPDACMHGEAGIAHIEQETGKQSTRSANRTLSLGLWPPPDLLLQSVK